MKIYCSPAKTMKLNVAYPIEKIDYPVQVSELVDLMKGYDELGLMKLYKCNEKIASSAYHDWQSFDELKQGNALLSYDGLQFKQLTCVKEHLDYVSNTIRIFSGLYGVLKPLDGVRSYRLDLENRIGLDLTDYWKNCLVFEDDLSLNLASKEYQVLFPEAIVVEFKINVGGKLKTQSTQAKMARGRFMDWCIANEVDSLEQVKLFQEDGYRYEESLSNEQSIVFVRGE